VNIQVNEQKLAVYDTTNTLKDIIYFEDVYPRNDELKTMMDGSKKTEKGRREILEENKLRVVNATELTNDLSMSFKGLYCVTLINEPKGMYSMKDYYTKYRTIFRKTVLIKE